MIFLTRGKISCEMEANSKKTMLLLAHSIIFHTFACKNVNVWFYPFDGLVLLRDK